MCYIIILYTHLFTMPTYIAIRMMDRRQQKRCPPGGFWIQYMHTTCELQLYYQVYLDVFGVLRACLHDDRSQNAKVVV